MNYKNLKIHTAVNLFVTIILSTLLINLVVVIFWYEHLVQQNIKSITLLIEHYLHQDSYASQIVERNYAIFLQSLVENSKTGVTKIIFNDVVIEKQNKNQIKKSQRPKTRTTRQSMLSDLKNSEETPTFFHSTRVTVFSLTSDENNLVGFSTDTSQIASQIWEKQKVILLYILFNGLVLSTILFFRFRKTLFKPMDSLLNIANNYQLNEGIWAIHPTYGSDFDQLSQAMNAMVVRIEQDRDKLLDSVEQLKTINKELKKAQKETMQAEKLASTGRLAAGFAHEIGNPVAIIQGYLELLQHNTYSSDEQNDFISRSLSELQRIDALLFQLMDLSKNKPQNEQEIDPFNICRDLCLTLQSTAAKANTSFILENCDADRSIFCDPEQLRQVILNFFLNAIDAIKERNSREKGEIRCTVATEQDSEDHTFVTILVRDNGAGIAKENLDNIFDPFYTTKPVGQGTGLGLSVAYRIIESLGGHIQVESNAGEGTTFIIFLPYHNKETVDDSISTHN